MDATLIAALERSVAARSVAVLTSVVFLVAALRLPAGTRSIWLTFWGYHVMVTLTDIVYDYQVLTMDEPPFPGITDITCLGCYVFAFVGLVRLARVASPGRDLEAWFDSLIISMAIVSLVGVGVIAPIVGHGGSTRGCERGGG